MLGLQIFDASGKAIFDTGFNTSRVLGIAQSVGASSLTGSVSHPGFATGRPFYMVSPKSIGQQSPYGGTIIPAFDLSFSGTTLSWTIYTGIGTVDCGSIIYGVY